MDRVVNGARWLLSPLQSKNVRTALAVVLAAYVAKLGWATDEGTIEKVLGVVTALVLAAGPYQAHEPPAKPPA